MAAQTVPPLRFDRRGTGASDPLPPDPLPAWEAYTEELGAVMDAVGSRRAALLANGPEAGPMALFSPEPGRNGPAH